MHAVQEVSEAVKPTASVVYIDRATATRWLAANAKNRNIRNQVVALYARDMTAGNWQFTGEAIKFSATGELLDGQHRLMAIIKADVSVPMLVVRNLPSESQVVMDSGAKRTASDALGIQGHKYANLVAATARLGINLDTGAGSAAPVSHSEIGAWVDANPDLADVITAASTARGHLPTFTPTALAYSWLILSRVDAGDAAAFFDSLLNNATMGKGDPRNTLLKRLAAARMNKERLSARSQVQFIVRAWNAWRRGEDLHVLRSHAADGKGGSTVVSIPRAV